MSDDRKKENEDGLNRDEWTESERQAEHKMRMRFAYRDLIEEIIQEGQEQGVFDNLRGAGKPLDLRSNPFEGDKSVANALMREHNLLPLWLQQRHEVHLAVDELRQDIGRRWGRHDQAFRLAQDDGRRRALALSWNDVCRRWEGEVTAINKLVDEFNLRRPSDNLEIIKLRLDDELKRAGAGRELG